MFRSNRKVGHSNRVLSLKCVLQDENLVVTSSLDRTVKIYDLRTRWPICSIHGSFVSGDALDIHGDNIVTGSYRNGKEM
jgi:WD40 repeat protein